MKLSMMIPAAAACGMLAGCGTGAEDVETAKSD